jgi:alpha-L-arabinofuranosidase
MAEIAEEERHLPGSRTEVDLGESRHMTINITDEGIILDVYQHHDWVVAHRGQDEHLGTVGMMFDEWADWVVSRDRKD